MSSVSSVRKISDDLARNHLSDVDELGEDFSPPFFGPGKWTWDRKMSSGSVLSDSSRRSSQDEQRKKKSSDGSLHQYLDYLGERRRSSDASVILTTETDSFIIGDRVWVGGTKPGQIAYIGETQFAPGDWAGVVLDDSIGKNDGSVANIRYFQCEAKKGVFSRLTRLTRYPILESTSIVDQTSSSGSYASAEAREARRSTGSLSATPPKKTSLTLTATPKTSISKPSSPDSALHPNIAVGERVIVMSAQGSKAGVLRFMGPTDFAPGEWCGVELDDPLGKNDGSVAGTRYFECRAKFGLFAPVHKVSRSPSSRRPSQANCQIHRRGSKESLVSATSSITSVRSSAPRKVAARVPTTPISTKNSLQDQLRTKDQHIEQLMRERELERAEVTRAATQADDAERQLLSAQSEWVTLQNELELRLRQSQTAVDVARNANLQLVRELDEEKTKTEDLLFRFEEASIEKESITAETAVKLRALELEKSFATEDDQNHLFELEEELIQSKLKITQLQEQLRNTQNNESQSSDLKLQLEKSSNDFTAEKSALEDKLIKMNQSQAEIQKELENKTNELEVTKKQLIEHQQQVELSAGDAGKKMNELNAKIIHLENALMKSNSEFSSLKKSVEEKDKKNSELATHLNELKEKSSQVTAEKLELLSKSDAYEKNSQSLFQNCEKLKKDLIDSEKLSEVYNQEITSLKDEKCQLESQIKIKSSINKELLEKTDNYEKAIKNLEEDFKKTEENLHASTNKIQSQQDLLKLLEDEKLGLLSQLTGKSSTNEELLARSVQSETQVKKLTKDFEKIRKSLNESENAVQIQKDRCQNLEDEKAKLQSEFNCQTLTNTEISTRSELTEKELTKLKEDFEIIQIKLSDSVQQLELQENKRKTLAKEKAELEAELAGKLSTNSELVSDREKIENESKKLSEILEKLRSELTESVQNLEAQEAKIKTLDTEKTNLASKLEEEISLKIKFKSDQEKIEKDCQKLSETLNKIQLDLTESVQKHATQQERINTLTIEKTNLESQLAEKLVSNSELHAQLQGKQTELNQREKQFEKLSLEHAGLNESLTSSKNEAEKMKISHIESEDLYKTKVQNLEFSIRELETKFAAEVEKLTSCQSEKSKLEAELSSFMNSSTDANAQLQAKHKELTEKDQKLQETLKELFEEKQNCLRLEQGVQKITTKFTGIEKSLTDQLETAKKSLAEYSEKVKEISNVNKNLDELKTKLEIEQALHTSTINSLTTQFDGKVAEIASKNQEIHNLQTELDSSSHLAQRQQQQIQQISDNAEKLQIIIETLTEKSQQTENELKAKIQDLQQKENDLQNETSANFKTLRQKMDAQADENKQLAVNVANLTMEKQQLLDQAENTRIQLNDKLSKDKDNYCQEIEKLTEEMKKIVNEHAAAEKNNDAVLAGKSTELNNLQVQIKSNLQKIKEKEQLLDTVHTRLEDTQSKLTDLDGLLSKEREKTETLEKQMEIAGQWKAKFDQLTLSSTRSETDSQRSVTNLQHELENVQADLSKYKTGYNKLETCLSGTNDKLDSLENLKIDFEAKLRKMTEENTQLSTAKVNYELEKESLDKQLEIGNVLLAEKENETKKLLNEIEMMQAEQKAQMALRELLEDKNRLLERRENECVSLRRENDQLLQEIRSVKIRKIDESNANIAEGEIPADEQIDFLNSVIVDMQKKNETLKARIQSLELGDSPDYADYDLQNITSRTVAPRLFCDICDRFDLHDTEDCPTQAMQEEDEVPVRNPNKPKSKPPAPRPYCETCEVFGHDTADCDDAETF